MWQIVTIKCMQTRVGKGTRVFRGGGIQANTDTAFEANTGTGCWLAVQSMYTGEPCESLARTKMRMM